MRLSNLLLAVFVAACTPCHSLACDGDLMQANARSFFTACEAGKGWNETRAYVDSDASPFSAQVVDALPGPKLSQVDTVKGYAEWMEGVVNEFGPKATVQLKAAAFDEERSAMVFYAVFMGYSDYVYFMAMDPASCKVKSMAKIWNDQYAKNNIPSAPSN